MALKGHRNSQSVTMVSGNKTQQQVSVQGLFVNITLPSESPYRGRIATIQFDWVDNLNQPAPVVGFGIGSLIPQAGGELFNFVQHSPSSYSVDVRFSIRSGHWTITVRSLAASLITDPSVKGPSADTSATIQLAQEIPIVKIGVPAERPITQRPVPITFDWVYADGLPAPVENFDLTDIGTDIGTLTNLEQVTGDASKYTAELTIPQSNTSTKVTITVSAEAAQAANSDPAVLGPEEDTARTFEIAAETAIAQVIGADAVCVLEKDIISNDYLNEVIPHRGDNAGGAFAGVLESVSLGSYQYLVVQIRKFTQTVNADSELVTPTNPGNFLSDGQAGAALIRVNTDTCQFELLKAYSDVTLAARSLAVDGTTLYFFEGSHYIYDDDVHFSDPNWREKVGYLYKIEHPSSVIEEVGLNWRSATTGDNPDTEETDYFYGVHGGTVSPIVAVNHPETTDPALHLLTGFGNFDDIGQPRGKHPVNRPGNWNWIQFHSFINQRLSEVLTNGRTGFDILKAVAVLTNAILGFDNDTLFVRPRAPQRAVNGGGSGITATQRSITAADLNRGEFPSEGWLFIGSELIKHSGANANGQFRRLVRGDENTTPAAHTGNFEITFVDHILSLNQDTLEMPIKSIVATNDNRQFYNRVRLRYGDGEEVLVEDENSIAENGARLLETDVPLDGHQRVWTEWLAKSYLARFKDIHQILNLTLKPTFFLKRLDVVYLKIPERLHLDGTLCQVLEIKHTFRQPPTTAVKLVTL